jgi:hypothetical protein
MWVAVNLHAGKDGQSFTSSVAMLFTKLNFQQHNLVLYLLQQHKMFWRQLSLLRITVKPTFCMLNNYSLGKQIKAKPL